MNDKDVPDFGVGRAVHVAQLVSFLFDVFVTKLIKRCFLCFILFFIFTRSQDLTGNEIKEVDFLFVYLF